MKILNPQYDDTLRNTVYPFLGSEPAVTADGYALSNDALLDCSILAPTSASPVVLHGIEVTGSSSVIFHFTLLDGTLVGTTTIGPTDPAVLPVLSADGRNTGFVRIDQNGIAIIRGWPVGTHFLDRQILPHLVVATPVTEQRVFILPDGTQIRGTLYLVGGPGVWIDQAPGNTGARINIMGDPYDGRTGPRRAIQRINGISVDNFILTTAPAGAQASYRVKIEPTQGGLELSMVGRAVTGVPT